MLPTFPSRRHGPSTRSLADRLRSRAFVVLYGPAARGYDRFTAWLFLGEWARWQRATLPLLPPAGVIVELGAGTGVLAGIGARPDRAWMGIEPSPSMLAVARKRARPGGPWFVRAGAGLLPIRSASVDAVVATFPSSYILADATAAEARRVLKPGGRFVVVLAGELAPHGRRRRARRFALRLFYGRAERSSVDGFALAGFVGKTVRIATRHGTAQVYVGSPVFESSGQPDGR